MKYISKPLEVEAMQFTRENINELIEWTNGGLKDIIIPRCIGGIMIGVLDTGIGLIPINEYDYIVKSEEGFVPSLREHFENFYYPVE